ncbi:stAR-related lipid transfer protein 5 [Anolis sagrei]|uniref:stAR-related lipid transfer protein 5 n=1 Tax=Anolis sagrei TaxID=38937 RepID=UPI00352240C9
MSFGEARVANFRAKSKPATRVIWKPQSHPVGPLSGQPRRRRKAGKRPTRKPGPFSGLASLPALASSLVALTHKPQRSLSLLAIMDYQAAATWAAEQLQSYRKDPDGWRSCKRTNEVAISWRPSSEFRGNLYKAEGMIPAKTEDVFKCLRPETGGLREKWDQNVKEVAVIETINENVCITRTTTPSAFMKIISPREFLDVVLTRHHEDGTIACMATHVDHPLCPVQPNYVRGLNYPCGCICIPTPGEPNKTQLLSFFQTDLGGNLPQTVVESFFPSSITGFYNGLAKAVVKLLA